MATMLRRIAVSGSKTFSQSFSPVYTKPSNYRFASTYPIDDIIFGLTDDQKQV